MVTAMARIEDQAALAAEPGDLAHERARGLDAVFRFGAGVFSILVLLIAWELFARSGKVTPFMLPPFSAVVARIYTDAVGGDLWINLGLTLYRAMTGFVIATVGGIALGAAMSRITVGALVLRSDHLGRLPDAEDRVSAGHHAVARPL